MPRVRHLIAWVGLGASIYANFRQRSANQRLRDEVKSERTAHGATLQALEAARAEVQQLRAQLEVAQARVRELEVSVATN